jgi:hypothetical protein
VIATAGWPAAVMICVAMVCATVLFVALLIAAVHGEKRR